MTRTNVQVVADHTFAVLGSNGMPNAAFVTWPGEGVIVVDSRFTPAYAEEMMEEIRAVTSDDVIALINTHFHCDHVLGNRVIPTDRIISHDSAKQELERRGDDYVEMVRRSRPDLADELVGVSLHLPTETFDDRVELRLGELALDLVHPGVTAHTDGDVWIGVDQSATLIAGDLVFNGIVPVLRDGDISGLRRALSDLAEKPFKTVIPGHGQAGGPELVVQQIEFIDAVIEVTEGVIQNGGSVNQAIECAVDEFSDLMFAERRLADWVQQASQLARDPD